MISGILLADKPVDCTSHDVVNSARKILRNKKVGHTGTLDPMASGLLVLTIGEATKLLPYFKNTDKKYVAGIKPGILTDTLDLQGKVLKYCEYFPDKNQWLRAFACFEGDQMQVPPMYSAKKVNGKKLYEYARSGIEIERSAEKITVNYIKLISFERDQLFIEVSCSSGTYIRSLVNDISLSLGTFGTLNYLRREEANGFSVNDSVNIEKFDTDGLSKKLILFDSLASIFNPLELDIKYQKKVINGAPIYVEKYKYNNGIYAVTMNGKFCGMAELSNGNIRFKRIFVRG